VDPDDPAAAFLATVDAPEPRRLLALLPAFEGDSVEVEFARCRAYLELGELDAAADSAWQAGRLLGGAADHDWRMSWHGGLLALAREDVKAAGVEFGAVYRDLPGEDAPKLALAYCAECGDDVTRAEDLYQAAWHRDRMQASAALGLARIRLSHGDRAGAVAVLAGVPRVSRHSEAAAIARVLVLSGRLSSGSPTAGDLGEVADRLPETYLDGGDRSGDARDRLTAVVREAALGWTRRNRMSLPVDGGTVLGDHPDETALRRLLEQSYHALARQARDADTQADLLDLANAVRPMTFL
jgi:serine/threonine-protein kinase PknG